MSRFGDASLSQTLRQLVRGFQNKKNIMRTQSKGFLALVVLAVTAAAPASAIPIVFDIEAIVTGGNVADYATGAVTPDDLLNGQRGHLADRHRHGCIRGAGAGQHGSV